MIENGYGRIINIASLSTFVSLYEVAAYAASKSGLLGFTKALALELAPEKITVNGISPGPFATEMNKPLMENGSFWTVKKQSFMRYSFTTMVPITRQMDCFGW